MSSVFHCIWGCLTPRQPAHRAGQDAEARAAGSSSEPS